jgi:hypothetical protein
VREFEKEAKRILKDSNVEDECGGCSETQHVYKGRSAEGQ